MANLGRNAPCHCGSGKKFKNCHLHLDEKKGSSSKSIIIGAILAFFLVFAVVWMFTDKKSSSGVPAPSEAPPGKVWSPEHGHWHDA